VAMIKGFICKALILQNIMPAQILSNPV